MKVLYSKNTSLGLVTIEETSIGYSLSVGGSVKIQSKDLSFIMREFNKYS